MWCGAARAMSGAIAGTVLRPTFCQAGSTHRHCVLRLLLPISHPCVCVAATCRRYHRHHAHHALWQPLCPPEGLLHSGAAGGLRSGCSCRRPVWRCNHLFVSMCATAASRTHRLGWARLLRGHISWAGHGTLYATVTLSSEPLAHCCRSLCYLQGHIGLDTAVWPEGTPGCALDTLARTPLWALGLNYRQATQAAGCFSRLVPAVVQLLPGAERSPCSAPHSLNFRPPLPPLRCHHHRRWCRAACCNPRRLVSTGMRHCQRHSCPAPLPCRNAPLPHAQPRLVFCLPAGTARATAWARRSTCTRGRSPFPPGEPASLSFWFKWFQPGFARLQRAGPAPASACAVCREVRAHKQSLACEPLRWHCRCGSLQDCLPERCTQAALLGSGTQTFPAAPPPLIHAATG